ncbi:MAG: (2Fe-2S) ferredoxin domain-containing protein [Mahellales bacterium]|jgi:NADP-reducing hydrogenase subunit HndB
MDVYNRLRENLMKDRESEQREWVINVQLGMCCSSGRGFELLNTIRKTIEENYLDNITVRSTGCMGMCSYEPIMEVAGPRQQSVTYCMVTPQRARLIVLNHILKGIVIKPWTLEGKGVGL